MPGMNAVDTLDRITVDMDSIGRAARDAALTLATTTTVAKNAALKAAAGAVRAQQSEILAANARDVAAGREKGLAAPLLDRLILNAARVEAVAQGLEDVAGLPDPVGTLLAEWERPNGLRIQHVRVPIGVIGVIYESRPNVTADAGGLCLKAGNAVILRGGSESFHSSQAIARCLSQGLEEAGLPQAAIQLVPTTDRAAVGALLRMNQHLDVIVPRGGKSLIERVMAESRVPVFAHLEGICHVYVDAAADLDMARKVLLNAKMRRVSVCGAAETLLIDKRVLQSHGRSLIAELLDAGCAVRGDPAVQGLDPRVEAATDKDWTT